MKTILSILCTGLISTATAQVLDTAENVAHSAARGAKNAAQTVAHGAKRAVDKVADVFTPEPDARRVDVTLTDNSIDMPTQLKPGKTAFVVKNAGKNMQNFEIEGTDVNRTFANAPKPGQTKVLHANLKRGSYAAYAPGKENKRNAEVTLNVR